MSTYRETIDFLYSQTPQFQQIGAAAYKPGLHTVIRLSEAFGNPHRRLRTIHVAGTNGKGSTAHSIAAVLQSAGYRVGLFTSPHLLDFRERMKINGAMIPENEVTGFVERFRQLADSQKTDGKPLEPSFFELTTVMAFDWFAREEVDYAVIEVGLGGRLDSTNIITPLLSVITNISFDHMAQLGDSLASIASEKAGIMKPGVPCVIGESAGEVREVFEHKGLETGCELLFADDLRPAGNPDRREEVIAADTPFGAVEYGLTGLCQEKNLQTIVTALLRLRDLGVEFPDEAVRVGLRDVVSLTGLSGRWMRVGENPDVICDTGHNEGGWRYLSRQLEAHRGPLIMILGFVNDKDISHILPMVPERAEIIYTRASVPRALPEETLAETGRLAGRPGQTAPTVAAALELARRRVAELAGDDSREGSPLVFVGGSTFIVADLLALGQQSAD